MSTGATRDAPGDRDIAQLLERGQCSRQRRTRQDSRIAKRARNACVGRVAVIVCVDDDVANHEGAERPARHARGEVDRRERAGHDHARSGDRRHAVIARDAARGHMTDERDDDRERLRYHPYEHERRS